MHHVRLTDEEIFAILQASQQILGAQLGSVKLYGSRADLTKKGGDIDLLVECTGPIDDKWAMVQRLRQEICKHLGEQKIDIFLVSTDPIQLSEREQTFLKLILADAKTLWSSCDKPTSDPT